MTQRAAIAIGSNLGDRAENLRRAVERLARLGVVRARSPIFETPPVGPPQPDYFNAAVLVETALEPEPLLSELLSIERELGRVRGERWGPRVIDLDLIAYGAQVVDRPGLSVPHPEAAKRAFVLVPLCEVAPDTLLRVNETLLRAEEALARLPVEDRAGVRRASEQW